MATAIEAVLGNLRDIEHEWAATQLARSRGATLQLDAEGRLYAADAASFATLEQALRDVAVYYRVGADEFISMTPAARLAYLREAQARGFRVRHGGTS